MSKVKIEDKKQPFTKDGAAAKSDKSTGFVESTFMKQGVAANSTDGDNTRKVQFKRLKKRLGC